MRVVKRSLNKHVVDRGIIVEEIEAFNEDGRARWIVIRQSPSGQLITKTDTFERAEALAISMVERVKNPDVHVAIGKDVGSFEGRRVYLLSNSYHWIVE